MCGSSSGVERRLLRQTAGSGCRLCLPELLATSIAAGDEMNAEGDAGRHLLNTATKQALFVIQLVLQGT